MSAIGEGLHQLRKLDAIKLRCGVTNDRGNGAAELAWRHPPECIRRKPQDTEAETDHLLPGKRLRYPHASCGDGGSAGLSPTPNVAAISAPAIRT